jgi:hypothetical protein
MLQLEGSPSDPPFYVKYRFSGSEEIQRLLSTPLDNRRVGVQPVSGNSKRREGIGREITKGGSAEAENREAAAAERFKR